MRLLFIPPAEGLPLIEGRLVAESGEPVEGVMVASVWDAGGKSKNAVSVTLVLEAVGHVPDYAIDRAINGLLAIQAATSPESSQKERQE